MINLSDKKSEINDIIQKNAIMKIIKKEELIMELTSEMLLMVLPLVAIQLGLAIFCIVKILKEGVQNLNKVLWILICLFVNLIGPVVFLIVGRRKDY